MINAGTWRETGLRQNIAREGLSQDMSVDRTKTVGDLKQDYDKTN